MNYKYVVFCPYFGKLPNNIELWIKSCSFNTDFKFVVFTNDDRKLNIPQNVEIKLINFEKFKEYVQKKFKFKISLDTPYKLCDYKIAYGYIFSEYLKNSEYWGACDMDLIFGDLSKFIPEDNFDKLNNKGHFMLIKNTEFLREAFMISNTSKINYKDILSNPIHFASDEIGSYNINEILKKNGYKVYDYENTVADILPTKKNMILAKNKIDKTEGKRIFSFEDGHIYLNKLENDKIIKKEFAYIHFQKRKMNMNINTKNINKFIITYNSFENYINPTKEYIISHQAKEIVNKKWFELKYKALINHTKRYLTIKKIIKER